MTAIRRKKTSRQRAGTTHGYGSMKKNRGAGHRGGRGNAGSGKRADVKKPSKWKNKKYFGKYGFTSKSRTKVHAINITYLDANAEKLAADKQITKEKDIYTVDLEKLGYNKLLGSGKIANKFKITVPFASQKAIEKVQASGGEVIAQVQETSEPVESE